MLNKSLNFKNNYITRELFEFPNHNKSHLKLLKPQSNCITKIRQNKLQFHVLFEQKHVANFVFRN